MIRHCPPLAPSPSPPLALLPPLPWSLPSPRPCFSRPPICQPGCLSSPGAPINSLSKLLPLVTLSPTHLPMNLFPPPPLPRSSVLRSELKIVCLGAPPGTAPQASAFTLFCAAMFPRTCCSEIGLFTLPHPETMISDVLQVAPTQYQGKL
jgi:hypothetical protein